VVIVNNEQYNDDKVAQELTSKGIGQAFRLARAMGKFIYKVVIKKIIAMLIPLIIQFIGPLLVLLLLFGFVYFSVFFIPKYIAEGSDAKGVIFNWGELDTWTLEQDQELIEKYEELDNKWINQFESFYTLANEKPDTRGGDAADEDAKVVDIWGKYMAVSMEKPDITSTEYDDIFKAASEKYKIDYKLIKALCLVESTFNPRAVSNKGCLGLMQLSPAKIKEYGITDPFDPEQNIFGGARYLSNLLRKYNNNIELAVAAYNAGTGAVDKYGGIPHYSETEDHVAKVMAAYTGTSYAVSETESGTNIIAERDQAEPFRVKWSLMGALDRVLGDPVVHGNYGSEPSGKGRMPNPEKRFAELKPELKWEDFELYYFHKWKEQKKDKDGNTYTVTHTESYTHNIRLLTYADSYEAIYSFNWQDKVIEEKSKNSYEKIVIPELTNVLKQGPYYEKLKNILADYELVTDMDLELVLQLAMNTDEEFYVDANNTGSLLEIPASTEGGYYHGSGDLIWPVQGTITSPFGYRVHPILKTRRLHTGIDIGCERGTEVRAAGDGIVILARDNGTYGKTIIIDHGKYRTLYAHLLNYKVKAGDEVTQGHVIAKADSTGLSTGNHLHFEVRTGVNFTEYIDPTTVLF